jgi:hypothetical protein
MPTTNGKIYLGSTLVAGGGIGADNVGAKVTKTNQTTSFATGDDGDLQEGRDVDFFTLTTNNPFGNVNRFTALDGSQTYVNDIIIDWSTYEGNIVLGYYRGGIATNRTWADSLTWAAGLNPADYTGWRLTNIKELQNLANYEFGGGVLTYSPVNLVSNSFWSSTTVNNNSAAAYSMSGGVGALSASSGKTSGLRTLACRNFTVTGTTLT